MGHPDRRHLSFDEKVKILEERVTVTKSVFITVNNTDVRAMIDLARSDYPQGSEAVKAMATLIEKLEQTGKIGAPLAIAYKMLLDMK